MYSAAGSIKVLSQGKWLCQYVCGYSKVWSSASIIMLLAAGAEEAVI